MQEYPQKDYYRLSEICRYTDTQPYVLRHWQSEFPELKPCSVSGQPMYRMRDIELVNRIKELLYDNEAYTLATVRKELAKKKGRRPAKKSGARASAATPRATGVSKREARPRRALEAEPEPAPERGVHAVDVDAVSRRRYQDAVDEIEHLRLAVKEAELDRNKAEERAEQLSRRNESACARLEQLEQILS